MKLTPLNWSKNYLKLFEWNEDQLNIFKWAKETDKGNLVVNALAGSGKTTTILGLIAALKGKIQVVAFNRHIVERIKKDSRVPKSRVNVSTAHSIGLSLLYRYFRGKPEIYADKYKDLIKSYVNVNIQQGFPLESMIRKELSIGNSNDKTTKDKLTKAFYKLRVEINNLLVKCQVNLTPLDDNSILEVIKLYGTDIPLNMGSMYWVCKAVRTILLKGEQEAKEKQIISFTDLLWLPNKWNLSIYKKFDWVIGDEAQDSNKAIIGLYKKYYDSGARIILLADPNQAIMGFAGSDVYSWKTLKDEFKPIELPLSYCYRCPKSHIELASNIVPHIKPSPKAEEGIIRDKTTDECIRQAMACDLVICRKNDSLIKTCLKMLGQGKKAFIRGRNIQVQLSNLLERITPPNCSLGEIENNLDFYYQVEKDKLTKKDNKSSIDLLNEKVNSLKACLKCFLPISNSIEELNSFINELFEDKENSVVLSTIHRAKGDEADVVWLLDSKILPFFKFCKVDWEYNQEINILYVALTRAKQCLYLVNDTPHKEGGINFKVLRDYQFIFNN